MITFDFDYYRPETLQEATDTYRKLTQEGKTAIYYAGGTEIICRSRLNRMSFDAVIDIKTIPEGKVFEFQGNQLVLGAAVTLASICETNYFPLLSATCRIAADHTAREMITLGGNICGKTPYREAVLPLLLCDSEIMVAGADGVRTLSLAQAFNTTLQLEDGEFLVQISLDKDYTSLSYANIRKTKQEKVDYPLIAAASIMKDQKIRLAFSGLCPYPFRSAAIEEHLSDTSMALNMRIDGVMGLLPAPILNDALGSGVFIIAMEVYKGLKGIFSDAVKEPVYGAFLVDLHVLTEVLKKILSDHLMLAMIDKCNRHKPQGRLWSKDKPLVK